MIIKSLQKIEQGQPKLLVLSVSESGSETREGPGAACARSCDAALTLLEAFLEKQREHLLVPYRR